MKLIDRYVTEVGKRLALVKGRADIEKELRSTLEDMLEDRAQKAGKPADEAMEMELLKQYGPPQQVAQTYNPHPYLIGPGMYPFFTRILGIVFFALTIAFIVTTAIEIVTHAPALAGPAFARAIGNGFAGLISTAMAAFGNIVLIFALIERLAPRRGFTLDDDKDWDPASLTREAEPDEVKPWEPILAIVFTFIALSIFNFNAQLIGIYTFTGETWTSVPLLSAAFFRWLHLINIAWIAEIILQGMLLRSGRWDLPARWVSIGIKSFQIVICYLLLVGAPIFAVTAESLQKTTFLDPEAAHILGTMAQQGSRALLGLILFLTLLDVIRSVYKLVMQKLSTSA